MSSVPHGQLLERWGSASDSDITLLMLVICGNPAASLLALISQTHHACDLPSVSLTCVSGIQHGTLCMANIQQGTVMEQMVKQASDQWCSSFWRSTAVPENALLQRSLY